MLWLDNLDPNPQSDTTRLHHQWSGGLCRTWVPCTALAWLILCIYPTLIHCSAAWKLLPSQEFRVVTRFMLAELAPNWSWTLPCSQINHPQRETERKRWRSQRQMTFIFFPPRVSFLSFCDKQDDSMKEGRKGREMQPQADTQTIAQLNTRLWPVKEFIAKPKVKDKIPGVIMWLLVSLKAVAPLFRLHDYSCDKTKARFSRSPRGPEREAATQGAK